MMEHKRAEVMSRGLQEAEQICNEKGVRFTKLRRMTLEFLLTADGPLKAYDIIELMRTKGERLTPATIYRTLDFLLHYSLAHRVNALNAFVPCTGTHEEHALLLFVCSKCGRAKELEDQPLYDAMRTRLGELGMSLSDNCIEIQGTCTNCTENIKKW